MAHIELDPHALCRVDALVEDGLRQGYYLCAVYAVVSAEAMLACRAFGHVAEEPAATTETVFDLASLTKPICTATSVLCLAERGEFHLGEEVRSFLTGVGPQWDGVTLRHLLTHSSGLPAWRK